MRSFFKTIQCFCPEAVSLQSETLSLKTANALFAEVHCFLQNIQHSQHSYKCHRSYIICNEFLTLWIPVTKCIIQYTHTAHASLKKACFHLNKLLTNCNTALRQCNILVKNQELYNINMPSLQRYVLKKTAFPYYLFVLWMGPFLRFFFRDSYTSFNQGFTHSEGNIQWHTPRILKGPQSLKRSAAHVKGFNLNHRFIALKGSYCTRFKQVVHLLETTVHTLKQTTCSSGTAKLFWNKYCTDKILKLETIVYR